LSGEGEVRFDAGTEGQIEIETDDNLLTYIQTVVSGSTLTISTERDVDIDPTNGVTYRLGCPKLASVRLSGSGSVYLASCTSKAEVELELSGAGSIVAPLLDASTVRVSLPGAGSIEAAGTTTLLDIAISGAGGFDGSDLSAAEATVRSTGVGTATVWVSDTLDLELSGVGSVRYYGEPVVTSRVTGVGAVESLGGK
jgi:hypothetical protein